MEKYTVKNGKKLRYGFTTGSCAAAAAAAAAQMLLTGSRIAGARINLPSGETADFIIEDAELKEGYARCAVIKDGGDDPDVTHGARICARAAYTAEGITLKGGEGVGVVTAKGLQVPPGEPAINPVPRKMILENTARIMEKCGYDGGLEIEISVPGGEEIARKTYNPRLGIRGGISILGTTGIVDPMSEKALVDTIKAVIDRQYEEDPVHILIAPGNYGRDFCREYLRLDIERAVPVSNYIGEALDYIRYKGFQKILFVGHTGKLIKIAAGVMNTHSSCADCRMEIIGVHSALNGAAPETVRQIMDCITTDDAFDLIKDEPYYEAVKKSILDKVLYHLNYRLKSEAEIETIMFTTDRRHIIQSSGAADVMRYYRIREDDAPERSAIDGKEK
ncbi:MAG: cobalt-precorrin-5B (C(1))-methyltransferase CbiD [Emergencia sp.]